MWTSVSFATLSDLILFLNVRRLPPGAFEIVVARDDDGMQLFHLVHQEESVGDVAGQAVQEAELLPVVEGAAAAEAAAAIEAAEDIIHRDGDNER